MIPLWLAAAMTLCAANGQYKGSKYVSRRAATKATFKTVVNYYLQFVVLAFTLPVKQTASKLIGKDLIVQLLGLVSLVRVNV